MDLARWSDLRDGCRDGLHADQVWRRPAMKSYLLRVAVSLSIFINVAFLKGKLGETVCAGCVRRGRKLDRRFCRLMELFEKNHCEKSIRSEE